MENGKKIGFLVLLICASAQFARAQEYKVGTYSLFSSDARRSAVEAEPDVSDQRYWCNSASAVASMIADLDCDVIGVQEVCDSVWGVQGENDIRKLVALKGQADYDWVMLPGTRSADGGSDVAVAYKKKRLNLLDKGAFYLGQSSHYYCLWARFEDAVSKQEFYFLNTHLTDPVKNEDGTYDHGNNKKNMQALRDRTFEMLPKDVPSIIVGNINADHNAKHWGSFSNARWYDLYQHYDAAGCLPDEIADWGTTNLKDESGFSKWKPDHIALHNFRPLGLDVDRRKFPTADGTLHYPSNHFPVVAKVAFYPETDGSIYNTPAPANKKTIRVISSNIRYMNNAKDLENGWDRRKSAIVAMMKDLKPAVVGFQECSMHQREYILGHCPEYDYVEYLIRRNDKNLKSYAAFTDPVMWDKSLLELNDWGAFYLSETPDTCSLSWGAAEPRTALWCHFTHKPTGKGFIFINTHLDHVSEYARKMELDLILDREQIFNPDGLPIVMLGDMNATPKSYPLDRLKAEWKDTRAEAKDSDSKYTFNGFGKSWVGTVDYIWYKGFKRCHDFKVVVRKYNHVPFISDHYPLRADLEL